MEKVSLAPILFVGVLQDPLGWFSRRIDWLLDYVMPLRWLSSTITEVAKLAAATMDPITVCSERGAPPGQIGWPFSCAFHMTQVSISSWATLDCADYVWFPVRFHISSLRLRASWKSGVCIIICVFSCSFWFLLIHSLVPPFDCKSYCHLPRGLGQKHTATLTTQASNRICTCTDPPRKKLKNVKDTSAPCELFTRVSSMQLLIEIFWKNMT